jgi:transposase InsO family protein
MSSNLLSVYLFCYDNDCAFYFDAYLFRIQDCPTGKHLYTGPSKDGLYPIHGFFLPPRSLPSSSSSCTQFAQSNVAVKLPLSSTSPACLHSICKNATSLAVWHSHLGHPYNRVLQHVLTSHLHQRVPSKFSFCKHCVQGKMTQLPFPHSTSTTHFPLELVHSDVWGPSSITSINGTRYFVIFVDDFSRFTWFFPLTHESQVLSSFIHFKNTMENLLNTSLKIIRTDCGGEYTKGNFTSFCSNSGIVHQFSCPRTSQQNGVAERKHRHIVDLSLTLISHSSLPLTYWPYAFATLVHLINRLPSPTRLFESP